jgi:hypothetical protein
MVGGPSKRNGGASKSELASLVSDDRIRGRRLRTEFLTFRAAFHYFVTALSREERDVCRIVTAGGKEWRRSDLLALYKPKLRRPSRETH